MIEAIWQKSIRLFAILLVCLPSAVIAATSAQDTFNDGMLAFRKGNYVDAAVLFEQAKTAGMDTPAVHYNLGVSYYKSGNYAQAEQAFLKTAKYASMTALARYNIGLVKLKLDDRKGAEKSFADALAASSDEKLSALCDYQLTRLKDAKTEQTVSYQAWTSFITAGIGYDDNVTLDNDTLTVSSAQSDTFYEFMVATRGVISGTRADGLLFKASLFGDIYQDLTDFDLVEGNIGLYKSFLLSNWSNEIGAYLTYSTLGGSSYLESANIEYLTSKYVLDDFRLRFLARYREIRAVDSEYDYIDGSQANMRLEGAYYNTFDGRVRVYYQAEHNDRNGYRTATTFSSLSPTRHTLLAEYSQYIGSDWYLKFGAEYRNSSYSEDNIEESGEIIARNDDRKRLLLTVERQLLDSISIAADYSYTDNQSNIDRYTYQRNLIMAYLLMTF